MITARPLCHALRGPDAHLSVMRPFAFRHGSAEPCRDHYLSFAGVRVLQQVPDDDEDGASHGDDGAFFAPAPDDPSVLVAELTAAFGADAGAIRSAARTGARYAPTDQAVLAAVRTASSIRQAWSSFYEGLKTQLMNGFRAEIAAAAAAQYNLPTEGSP